MRSTETARTGPTVAIPHFHVKSRRRKTHDDRRTAKKVMMPPMRVNMRNQKTHTAQYIRPNRWVAMRPTIVPLGDRRVEIYPELSFPILQYDARLVPGLSSSVHQGGEPSWKDPSSAWTP